MAPGGSSGSGSSSSAQDAQSANSSPPPTVASCSSSKKLVWIEIRLVDMEGNPVAGAAYRIKTPDGKTVTGSLDQQGQARVDGIPSGSCAICFTDFDADAWGPL
jgi:hypothetical protein